MEQQEINTIGFEMEQALGSMTDVLASALLREGIDLPHSQYVVLRLLYSSSEPLTQVQIAAKLKKNASAIKRTVDILERKRLVVREAHTGRSNYVIPTSQALELKDKIIATANTTLHHLFSPIPASDLTTFLHVLKTISGKG